MIEKKISYEINIEKPSKTKPVKQGGVLNYLGKQKTVNAPVKWRSSPKHPVAHLSYITKDEEKILIDLNLYGSLKGKPNRGPFGLPSLQGSGGGAGGGDGGGGGDGDSGDSGTGQSGAQSGDNTDGNNEGGTSGGPGTDGMGGPGGFGGDDGFGSDAGPTGQFGAQAAENTDMGPAGIADSFASDVDESNIMSISPEEEGPKTARLSPLGITAYNMSLLNPEKTFSEKAMNFAMAPATTLLATAYDQYARGVTGPSDYTQETSSVQISAPNTSQGGGGITTLPQYAPLYNQVTGDPLLDSLIARYRASMSPSSYGV